MSIGTHRAALLVVAALAQPVWANREHSLTAPSGSLLAALQEHRHHDHDHDEHDFTLLPPALGARLHEGWFDPWPHTHYARRGTPKVHPFANEPAFLGRDFFLDFSLTKGPEGTEVELEAELEYSFTRRIGLVIEAPYVFLNPRDESSENGIGDIAIAPRFLLLEYDRFILSTNLEISFPTGDGGKGLGAGEAAINPSVSTWFDLGRNVSLQANAGVEHGFRTDSETLTWGGALTYTMYLHGEPELFGSEGALRAHFPAGMLNLIAEIRGEHPLDGEDRGSGTAALILGASYTLSPHIELRGALLLPAWSPREFDAGMIAGLIYHF